jgi:hypothetical protein
MILERQNGLVWAELILLRIGIGAHGNEPSGSIKCWEVLEQLNNWQPLKNGLTPFSY